MSEIQSYGSEATLLRQSSFNGNQPNNGMSFSKVQQLFNLKELKTNYSYQKTVKNIADLLKQFDKFTDNLEQKIDFLLSSQRNQFVESYRHHMKKIENQYKLLQQESNRQQQLIKYYQNEGKMSNLVKKVGVLQVQSKRLYEVLMKKQKEIKKMELEVKVQKQENKRLYNQMKELIRNKKETQTIVSMDQKQRGETIQYRDQSISYQESQKNFFTTQLLDKRNIKKDLSITTDQKRLDKFTYNLSQKSLDYNISDKKEQNSFSDMKVKKQLASLTLKNRKLLKFSSKIMSEQTQLQNLFINAVNDIKKQITVRKKIKECSYDDFLKQDKINLLITIISNEQILKFLYEKLFSKGQIQKKFESIQVPQTTPKKVNSILPFMKQNRTKTPKRPLFPYI